MKAKMKADAEMKVVLDSLLLKYESSGEDFDGLESKNLPTRP